jgi:hypothetical protein
MHEYERARREAEVDEELELPPEPVYLNLGENAIDDELLDLEEPPSLDDFDVPEIDPERRADMHAAYARVMDEFGGGGDRLGN